MATNTATVKRPAIKRRRSATTPKTPRPFGWLDKQLTRFVLGDDFASLCGDWIEGDSDLVARARREGRL